MEHEVSDRNEWFKDVKRLVQTDGEVVPLGPVDKDGHRVPLDTTSLYGSRGEHYKVKSFVHFPLMDGWFMECAFTKDLIDVSSLHLKAPDSWKKLEEDLDRCVTENTICRYYSIDGTCGNCTIYGTSYSCSPKVLEDIKQRIRKLRGDSK